MESWDFRYKKTGAPVALDNAPTVDGGADDPSADDKGTAQAFNVGDKYGTDTAVQLVICSEGGGPTVAVYVWSKTAGASASGKWILLKDAIAVTATAPAYVAVPPHAKVAIRITAAGGATAVYAGLLPS